jgi:hypothetical protein
MMPPPRSSAHAHNAPDNAITRDIFLCAFNKQKWLVGFSWNLVWRLYHKRLLQTHTLNFPHSAMDAEIREVGRWWRHYSWSFAHAHHKPANPTSPNPSSQVISVCTHLVVRKWLVRSSWNLVWKLRHWRLLKTDTVLLPAINNSNVSDAQIREVGRWRHYPRSSAHEHHAPDNVFSRDIILYEFSDWRWLIGFSSN